jgi:flagellar hook protein FlgE
MGIFDALTTAVSGLSAQSYALQNISGNIANSQTTAFKRIDTSFQDLMSDNLPSKQLAGGVLASSVATNNVQGDIQNETTSTFMAINGSGYFIVAKPETFKDNQPVFGGVNLYSRRGDYQMDKNGFLVNGAGYYLMGNPLDPTTGNPVGSVPQVLQFNNNLTPAEATTQIDYNANVPSQPKVGLLNSAAFVANPVAGPLQPASLVGFGAALQPDAPAKGTGTVTGLANGTVLTALGITAGDTITVQSTSGTNNFVVGGGSTVANLIAGLTGGAAAVTVSLTGSGALQIVSNNGIDNLTISDNATPAGNDISKLGFGSGNTAFTPVNLITQGAVAAGQNLTLTVGPNPMQTIVFGTGGGQVATLAGLNVALKALLNINVAGTGVDPTNGNITITAANTTDTMTIGGTFNPVNFGIHTTQAWPANETVYGIDQTTFLNESLAGGSITCYDGTGAPVNMQFRWAKIDSASLGGTHTDKWNLFYQVNSNPTNTQAAWLNSGTNFTFDSSGQLNPAISGLTLNNVSVDGISLGSVQVVFGANGLTQFANTSGTVQVLQLSQNGSAAGELQSIAVDQQGRIVGTYSNGRTIPLANVSLANFNGQNYLKQLNGGAYAETADSGPPLLNATGTIVGSSLEASNTDIADEFSKLIVTQQAYSANTRIITTTNQMVQDLLNVIR